MITIYKYKVERADFFNIDLPEGSKFLHIAEQTPGHVNMWWQVDTAKPLKNFKLGVFGTGEEMPPGMDHLGTFLMNRGAFVLHLFQKVGD